MPRSSTTSSRGGPDRRWGRSSAAARPEPSPCSSTSRVSRSAHRTRDPRRAAGARLDRRRRNHRRGRQDRNRGDRPTETVSPCASSPTGSRRGPASWPSCRSPSDRIDRAADPRCDAPRAPRRWRDRCARGNRVRCCLRGARARPDPQFTAPPARGPAPPREFAADASHELRTPLTVVRSSVERPSPPARGAPARAGRGARRHRCRGDPPHRPRRRPVAPRPVRLGRSLTDAHADRPPRRRARRPRRR